MAGGIAPNRQGEKGEGVVAHTISSPSVSRLDTGSFFDTGSCRFLWSRDGAPTLTLTLAIAHITTVAKCQSVGWTYSWKRVLSAAVLGGGEQNQ